MFSLFYLAEAYLTPDICECTAEHCVPQFIFSLTSDKVQFINV